MKTVWHDAEALKKEAGGGTIRRLVGLPYAVLEEAGKECGLFFEGAALAEKHGHWELVYKSPASSELINLHLGDALVDAPLEQQAKILANLLMSRCLDLDVSLPGC